MKIHRWQRRGRPGEGFSDVTQPVVGEGPPDAGGDWWYVGSFDTGEVLQRNLDWIFGGGSQE